MSLHSFLSYIRTTDIARSNRYIFTIIIPPKLNNNYRNSLETLSLFANDISSAFAWNAGTKGQSHGTIPYNTPYAAFNEDSSFIVNFLMDGNMHIRHFFDDWAGLTYDPETGKTEYYDNLRTTVRLELLNQSDVPVYAWEFYDVTLDKLAPISLSNGSNKFLDLIVTFNYRYWKKVKPTPVNYQIRQESNTIKTLYQIIKPYIASRFPALGRIEQTSAEIGIGIRAITGLFGLNNFSGLR